MLSAPIYSFTNQTRLLDLLLCAAAAAHSTASEPNKPEASRTGLVCKHEGARG